MSAKVAVVAVAVVLTIIGLQQLNLKRVVAAEEQAVIVTLTVQSDADVERIHALEDALTAQIKKAGTGEFDGDEFGEGTCTLYMYGPSAEHLFRSVIDSLKEFHPAKGSYLVKRLGKPGAKQERVELAGQ